jgi:hypothetical protein
MTGSPCTRTSISMASSREKRQQDPATATGTANILGGTQDHEIRAHQIRRPRRHRRRTHITLFAGKPKIGKSWLLLHAAIAVARGGFTLGEIKCPEGDVPYCALEDNLRRLKSRMIKLPAPMRTAGRRSGVWRSGASCSGCHRAGSTPSNPGSPASRTRGSS